MNRLDFPLNVAFDPGTPEFSGQRGSPVEGPLVDDEGDPLRLKIVKRLQEALRQIDGEWPVYLYENKVRLNDEGDAILGGDGNPIEDGTDGGYAPDKTYPRWHNNLSSDLILLDEVEWLDPDKPMGILISQRPRLDYDERIREQLRLGEPNSQEIFELLVQGRPIDPTADSADKLENTYKILEDVRRRIAFLKFDEQHPKRVFRISGKHNTCLRISSADGTITVDEREQVGFWLRLALFLVEDFADSARGEA